MIASLERSASLDRDDIQRLFNDADDGLIVGRHGAPGAGIHLRDILAHGAEPDSINHSE